MLEVFHGTERIYFAEPGRSKFDIGSEAVPRQFYDSRSGNSFGLLEFVIEQVGCIVVSKKVASTGPVGVTVFHECFLKPFRGETSGRSPKLPETYVVPRKFSETFRGTTSVDDGVSLIVIAGRRLS